MGTSIARARHQAGAPYAVLIGSATTPSCFIEMLMDKRMVGVGFLDDEGREFEAAKVILGTTYIFNQQGSLVIRREHLNPYRLEEIQSTFDPTGNYEPAPAFGDYSTLMKINR